MKETEKLVEEFQNRKMSRRQFVGRMTALGASGIIAPHIIGQAIADTPVPGGHMRFAIGHGSTADSFDPGKVLNGFLSTCHYSITNTLTEVDTDGQLVPKLAESWESTSDAKQWTFKLRDGVEFHDGKSLGTDDVIASINHHRGEKSESSAKTMVDPITDIKADGSYVTVELEGGDADFPYKLSSFNFPIYQANADGSLNWENHVGVGGYILKDLEPGVRATLERNPNYWQDNRAHFDSAELLTIADGLARQTALISGEVDGIDRVDLKTAKRLAQKDGIVVEQVPGKTHYTFPMQTNQAPFDNADVRMALKLAIDRESMLKTVLHGYGSVGNDQPINAAYPFFDGTLEPRVYDPEMAKHYLNKAGLSELSVDLSTSDAAFSGAVDAAVLFGEYAKKAGISINVRREPSDGYWSNVWMKKAFCACYWPGYPTPDSILTQAYSSGAPWNDTFWDNPRFNELLLQARSELDPSLRAEMYGEMQRMLRDDGGLILPFFADDVFAISTKVGHGQLSSNYEVDGRLYLERWWFKSA